MVPFQISTDQNSWPTYAITFSDHINVQVLASGVAETITTPSGANFVLFSSTSNFYCRANGTAVVPTGDITNGSGSELNPVARSLRNVSSISLISPGTCTVTMAFYA